MENDEKAVKIMENKEKAKKRKKYIFGLWWDSNPRLP